MDIPFPEPETDLRAQLSALLSGLKPAVFISSSNSIPAMDLPADILAAKRPEGALFTRNPATALAFKFARNISESDMASWLDYPEPKSSKTDKVIQVRDDAGSVITECAVSNTAIAEKHFARYGGNIVILSIPDALKRRKELIHGTV